MFKSEAEFETELVRLLTTKGWESEILEYKTEKELIDNWAKILFENNNTIDRLNGQPLTNSEMAQILEKISELKTSFKLNGFINGKTISIKRDNPADKAHLGKEISLKIYDRAEIAAGQSRYQIARQPKFKTSSLMLGDRRGDMMLLINGMPLFHIELKNSGVPISQACEQVRRYVKEGVFKGVFSLVQIFVAMTPERMLYFANVGEYDKFKDDFFFGWADFNNEPINDYKQIADRFLSIPMAHQMIGFYTIADKSDETLKVMRSYQFYAARAISNKVAKNVWGDTQRGGYIWHTTGSGKTMTSFKSAELIANSGDADKVVFLTDRIELGTQSLENYKGFAGEDDSVQGTENTYELITKLKSSNTSDTLIVTSIQKMSKIKSDSEVKSYDIETINKKRIVFIVDEAHRSTFGDMMNDIKSSFKKALFFGFTGTPIYIENQKSKSTTSDIFGDELHRYSISDGIRDKNVLGFDTYMVATYNDDELREAVALKNANAKSRDEIYNDKTKIDIFNKYMLEVDMLDIEKELPITQYKRDEHRSQVVKDIKNRWQIQSVNGKFHAIFATSSIDEAIEYYRLIKKEIESINITCLFDPNIDNNDGFAVKEDGLVEILTDYNAKFGQNFIIATHDKFKKDLSLRLAHKEHYKGVSGKTQLDLLIVVEQMLTGFDSKWINTLYIDKVFEYEKIIQAFSRTNRIFGADKPFGTIRYYRLPYTMQKNIAKAVGLYSGDKPLGLFVCKIAQNISSMNDRFKQIDQIFKNAGIVNFMTLPSDDEDKIRFAKLFNELNGFLQAAKIQGFTWDQTHYKTTDNGKDIIIKVEFDKTSYDALLMRYGELCDSSRFGKRGGKLPAFDINGELSQKAKEKIDNDYMQAKFVKYIKALNNKNDLKHLKDELHKVFATLSIDEQKYANMVLADIESGELKVGEQKSLQEYINEYKKAKRDKDISNIVINLGLDEVKFKKILENIRTKIELDASKDYDELKVSINRQIAKEFFEKRENRNLKPFELSIEIDKYLRAFILDSKS